DYANHWLPQHVQSRALSDHTHESYEASLRLHILPLPIGKRTLGDMKVVDIGRPILKAFAAAKREAGYARDSVRGMIACLSTLLNAAVEDELIDANPALRLRGALRLTVPMRARS